MTARTITIYAYLQETLETRIERANRRAKRIGQPGYTITITPADPEPVYDEDRIARWHRDENGNSDYPLDSDGRPMSPTDYRQRVTATIDGIVPAIPGGWQLVGLVDEDPVIGPMPRLITDEGRKLNINLDDYRDLDTWNECDHCHTNRDRAKVYLLHSTETGQIVRVGRTCLAVFLGLDVAVPEPAFGVLKEAEDLEEMTWGGGSDDTSYRIDHVLAISHAMVATYGWLSSANARYTPGATSTGERVSLLMKAKGEAAFIERADMIDSVSADTLAELMAYARDLRDHDDSEYARTVSAIVRGTHDNHQLVSGRNIKMLASVVSGYQRAKAREIERATAADSEFVGEVKKRGTFEGLRVIFTRVFDSMYGEKQLIKFVDAAGNILVWWNTGKSNPQVGETYNVTGTVKSHDIYEDVNQTILTRCKLVAC